MIVVGGVPSVDIRIDAPEFVSGTTMANIQKRGVLRAGVKFDAPFLAEFNAETLKPEGLDIEIVKRIAQSIFGGTVDAAAEKIEYVEVRTKGREDRLESGDVDFAIGTYCVTHARRRCVRFTSPYISTTEAPVIARGSGIDLEKLDDMNGKVVCAISGTTNSESLYDVAPHAELLTLDTVPECVNALRSGRAQAWWAAGTANYVLAARHEGEFTPVSLQGSPEYWAIGVRKSDRAFTAFLDEQLAMLLATGDLAAMKGRLRSIIQNVLASA